MKHESRCYGITIAEEVFQDLQLLKISGKWNGNTKMGCIFWCRQLRFESIHAWKDSQRMLSILEADSMKRLTQDDSLWQKHRPSGTALRSFIRMTPKPTVSMGTICVVEFVSVKLT